MKTTTNLGLKKIELTDSPPDITVQDANWDLIDKHLYSAVNYQKSGGTGTAITLNDVTLTDGFSKTFIVATSNNSAATTINGKPLYKKGTTTAPKLVSENTVQIWYNSTNDCFYTSANIGDADTVDGKHVCSGATDILDRIPIIAGNSVMEIGKYLDFHNGNDGTDYLARLEALADGMLLNGRKIHSTGIEVPGNGTSIITFASNFVKNTNTEDLNVWTAVRIMNCTDYPSNYGYTSDNDFYFVIIKINTTYWRAIAYDVRSSNVFTLTKHNGTPYWSRMNDGGNADSVDNIHGTDLKRRTGVGVATNIDILTLATGHYHLEGVVSTAYNHPYTSGWEHFTLDIIGWGEDNGNCYKVILAYNSQGNMYIKTKEWDHWLPWRKVWHDGNDGAGSGLDADTLDGLHNDRYMRMYILNSINIDTQRGCWVVNLSEAGHGSAPDNSWWNIMQFEGDHFLTQIATRSSGNTEMWMRTKYTSDAGWGGWKSFGSEIYVSGTAPTYYQTGSLWIW